MRAQVLQSARSELKRFVVIVPVFNDWVSASRVCELLDEEAAKLREVVIEVLHIDDGSPQLPEDHWREPDIRNISAVRILRLRANLGHQRAICIGLCYVVSELGCD